MKGEEERVIFVAIFILFLFCSCTVWFLICNAYNNYFRTRHCIRDIDLCPEFSELHIDT